MASFKPKEVVSILQKLGFLKKRQTGSHLVLFNPKSQIVISVPIHTKDVRKGLMKSIIKQADSKEEEFIKLK